jgi:hypothetical protein
MFYPGSRIRVFVHPGSGKNSSRIRIPDPGGKKAPDPGSGSATLTVKVLKQIQQRSCVSDPHSPPIYADLELVFLTSPDPVPAFMMNANAELDVCKTLFMLPCSILYKIK